MPGLMPTGFRNIWGPFSKFLATTRYRLRKKCNIRSVRLLIAYVQIFVVGVYISAYSLLIFPQFKKRRMKVRVSRSLILPYDVYIILILAGIVTGADIPQHSLVRIAALLWLHAIYCQMLDQSRLFLWGNSGVESFSFPYYLFPYFGGFSFVREGLPHSR